jgi:histidine triad (HIT) family protein
MDDCIFCKIIKGEVKGYKVYEDNKVCAILDHRPVREGATMVIPKLHMEHFIDLPDDLVAHIVAVGNKIGRKMQEVLEPKRIGFAVAGFGVPHVHYHVIPMHHEHDITSGVYARCENNSLIFDVEGTPLAVSSEQERIVDLLKI